MTEEIDEDILQYAASVHEMEEERGYKIGDWSQIYVRHALAQIPESAGITDALMEKLYASAEEDFMVTEGSAQQLGAAAGRSIVNPPQFD